MGLLDLFVSKPQPKEEEPKETVFVSTGTVNKVFEVLDCIFAIDSHEEGFFSSSDPNKAFEGVKKNLIYKCKLLGGDAVLDCEFEYRNALSSDSRQVIEIFAYGTVVKFLEEPEEVYPIENTEQNEDYVL